MSDNKITQIPTMPKVPKEPTPIELAKNNLIQQMNSIGGIANLLIQNHVSYMGVSSITENDVDKSIETAQQLVFKMNEITTIKLAEIDDEMGEPEILPDETETVKN